MPQPYPDPAFNTTTGMIQYTNTVTSGWMTPLVTVAIFIIFLILLKVNRYRTSDSLLVSSFLTFLLSSTIWAAGLLEGRIIVLYLLFTVASALYSMFDN